MTKNLFFFPLFFSTNYRISLNIKVTNSTSGWKKHMGHWLLLGDNPNPFSEQCRFFYLHFLCKLPTNSQCWDDDQCGLGFSAQSSVLCTHLRWPLLQIQNKISVWKGKVLVLLSFTTSRSFPLKQSPLLDVLLVLMFSLYSSLLSILLVAIKPIKRVRHSTSSQ